MFNAIPTKISMKLKADIEKSILKIIGNYKNHK
jgi:hypothetical protein